MLGSKLTSVKMVPEEKQGAGSIQSEFYALIQYSNVLPLPV